MAFMPISRLENRTYGGSVSGVIDRLSILALLGLIALGCGYQPARYAPTPPVLEARDHMPVALPARRLALDELYHAEAHLDAALVKGLEVSAPERAVDINSLDDVVRSSWFRGGAIGLEGYVRQGAPVPPLSLVDSQAGVVVEGALMAEDARGIRYQLVTDAPGFGGMRTTALAVASRLMYALGYRVAEVHVTRTPGGQRAAALRFEVGRDLGPTPMLWTRPDDPNDVLSHLARRSLRASWVAAAWLGIGRFHEATFRDIYVGAPGRGHVEHWVVALQGALGAWEVERNVERAFDASRDDVGFFGRLGSLGLTKLPPPPPTQPSLVGAGIFPPEVDHDFSLSPPFAPHKRMRADDAYWLAARMLAVDWETIQRAVAAAGLEPAASNALCLRLHERRLDLVRRIFASVTPLELAGLEGDHLELRDLERAAGIERGADRGYRALIVDDDGALLSASPRITVRGAKLELILPPRQRDYEVVRLWRLDAGDPRPRPLEIHLARESATALRGLRH
jgi:hypothetical protein